MSRLQEWLEHWVPEWWLDAGSSSDALLKLPGLVHRPGQVVKLAVWARPSLRRDGALEGQEPAQTESSGWPLLKTS